MIYPNHDSNMTRIKFCKYYIKIKTIKHCSLSFFINACSGGSGVGMGGFGGGPGIQDVYRTH